MSENRTANKLASEKSIYLLQHAFNPVQWMPWGEEAFRMARETNRPIFLSAGYASCHWCRVMEMESFTSDAVAAILNERFIPVKLDREEHPDIDRKLQFYLSSTGVRGGWPLSVFLMPDGTPFYGGTYYPPEARGGLPAFTDILTKISDVWQNGHDQVEQVAQKWRSFLDNFYTVNHIYTPISTREDELLGHFTALFDTANGGLNRGPKFPNIPLMLYLLDFADRPEIQLFLRKTGDQLVYSGIRDHLRGGFFRYSVDSDWNVPHFEKMLTDQALNSIFLTRLYDITGEVRYLHAARTALEWALADLSTDFGLASSLDADSTDAEGNVVEGGFYTLNANDFSTLNEKELVLIQAYTEFNEGVIRVLPCQHDEYIAVSAVLEKVAARVNVVRTPPRRDNKVVAAYNFLFCLALLEYSETANDEFFMEQGLSLFHKVRHFQVTGDFVYRLNYGGEVKLSTTLEDFTTLYAVLMQLHRMTREKDFLTLGNKIADRIMHDFGDGTVICYDRDHSFVETFDEALCSPFGFALQLLLENRHLNGFNPSQQMLDFAYDRIEKFPAGHPTLIRALRLYEEN